MSGNGDILLHRLPEAAAAVPALIRSLLPEVAQQEGAQAATGAAVVGHPGQPLEIPLANLFLFGGGELFVVVGGFDHKAGGLDIAGGKEEDTVRRGAVTAGTARLLIVALQVLGHIVVDHKADIRLVDAHTEGVGCHHHPHPVVEKVLLVAVSLLIRETGVIPGRRIARRQSTSQSSSTVRRVEQ